MTSSSCSIFDGGTIGWTLSLASVDCIQCSKRHMSFSNCDQFCSEHSGHITELLDLKTNMVIIKIIMTNCAKHRNQTVQITHFGGPTCCCDRNFTRSSSYLVNNSSDLSMVMSDSDTPHCVFNMMLRCLIRSMDI